MIEFNAPFWLLGLIALPLIWWLHHYRRLARTIKVSALFLWRGQALAQNSNIQRSKIDPNWKIRAIIVCLFVVGLSEPIWLTSSPRNIEIWFDNSISMQTLENGTPRSALAIDATLNALSEGKIMDDEVTVRSLVNLSNSLKLPNGLQHSWRKSFEARIKTWIKADSATELLLPPPQQMNNNREHWLVTDGADPSINPWVKNAPLSRIIPVGNQTENAALTHFAIRPSLINAGAHDGLLVVQNLGRQPITRQLQIRTDQQIIKTIALDLRAAEKKNITFQLDTLADGQLSAIVTPSDALPIDDALSLISILGGKISVNIDTTCGKNLRKALHAHPYLNFVEPNQYPKLMVACGAVRPRNNTQTLWMHTSDTTNLLPTKSLLSAPYWQAEAGALQKISLKPRWLKRFIIDRKTDPSNKPTPSGTALLLADNIPLVIDHRPKLAMTEVLFDLEYVPLTRQAEFPLLVSSLIDYVLNRSTLDTIIHVGRPSQSSIIAPVKLTLSNTPTHILTQNIGIDLSWIFVLAAAAFLLVDFLRIISKPTHLLSMNPPGLN